MDNKDSRQHGAGTASNAESPKKFKAFHSTKQSATASPNSNSAQYEITALGDLSTYPKTGENNTLLLKGTAMLQNGSFVVFCLFNIAVLAFLPYIAVYLLKFCFSF